MALSRKQLALIHVAKKQLGLSDGDYRMILLNSAGVETARDLDTGGLDAVMRRFQALGFTPSANPHCYGPRPGMATTAQVGAIRAQWREYTDGEGTDSSLGRWLFRTCGVSHVRFLTSSDASKAITGLRAMLRRKIANRIATTVRGPRDAG